MPQTISPDTSRKLATAADSICSLVDSGVSATDAAVKVARDNGLTEGQIELVCRAYNAGSVTATRENGDSLEDKTAAIGLADIAAVKAAVFQKTASAVHSVDVHPMYALGATSFAKTASVSVDSTATKSGYCTCGCNGKPECVKVVESRTKSANRQLAREKLAQLGNVKHALLNAQDNAQIALDKLSRTFSMVSDASKGTITAYYYKYASQKYGELGQKVMDTVSTVLSPLQEDAYENFKTASVKQHAPLSGGLHAEVDATCDAFIKWAMAEEEFPFKVLTLRYEIQQLVPEVVKQAAKSELRLLDDEENDREELEKTADIIGTAIGTMMGQGGGQSPGVTSAPDSADRDMLLRLSDPNHEAKLKAIRVQSMLHDLAKNDDIISSYTPQEVSSAFNEISQSAPKVISNAALLRANLRRALQGNLSPFEAKEILASQALLNNRPTPGGGV